MLNLKDKNRKLCDFSQDEPMTVPSQSLSVAQVMERFACGIPAEYVKQAFYDEDKMQKNDFDDLDSDAYLTREPGFGFEEAAAAADALEERKSKASKSKKVASATESKDD